MRAEREDAGTAAEGGPAGERPQPIGGAAAELRAGGAARAARGAAEILGPRRSARSLLYGVWYVTEHQLVIMRSYFTTILMGSVLNPVMYLFAIGVGIGAFVNSNAGGRGPGGVPYIVFVGPALLASSALTVAFEESAFPVMAGFKWQKVFFAMNATPVTGGQIATGMLLAMGLRVAFTVAAFWAFLAAFGAAPAAWSFLAVPAALLGGLSFGALIVAFASGIEDDEGWFTIVQRLIIAPMFLFSGTFFPLESLPLGLQWIGWISPLWHATQLGRVATYGLHEAPALVAAHILYLGALQAAGLFVSFRNFDRRLSK